MRKCANGVRIVWIAGALAGWGEPGWYYIHGLSCGFYRPTSMQLCASNRALLCKVLRVTKRVSWPAPAHHISSPLSWTRPCLEIHHLMDQGDVEDLRHLPMDLPHDRIAKDEGVIRPSPRACCTLVYYSHEHLSLLSKQLPVSVTNDSSNDMDTTSIQ